jgi:hypothetical protein
MRPIETHPYYQRTIAVIPKSVRPDRKPPIHD